MARDIEEFLRRAAERRKQQQQGQQPARQTPPPTPRQQAPRQPAPQPRPQMPRMVIGDNAGNEIIELSERDIRSQSVAAHVQGHINTGEMADHATQLGGRIVSVHDQTDQQVHQRLDHDLTVLDDKPSVYDEAGGTAPSVDVSPLAYDLIQMLRSPASFRQAILLSEILQRPSFDD